MTALQGSFVLESPLSSSDPALEVAVRDVLLRGVANEGVRFIADLGFAFSYPAGPFSGRPAPGAPANGALIGDVAERNNGSVVLANGQMIGYAGGGFDFSAVTVKGNYLAVPAEVAHDIYTPFNGASQRPLVVAYVKLPTKANWNTATAIFPMIAWGSANASAAAPDMVTIGQSSISSRIEALRQTAGATLVSMNVAVADEEYGQLAQLVWWRNAAGTGLSLRTSRGRTTTLGAVGPDNTSDFSAQIGRLGVCDTYSVPSAPASANAGKFRAYRMFIENLARSGRDPLTVVEADWLRVQARMAASAASGGASQVFA